MSSSGGPKADGGARYALPDGEEFVGGDGTSVKYRKLIGFIASALTVLAASVVTAPIQTLVRLNVWAITGTGAALARIVRVFLGETAAVQTQAWAAAFAQAVEIGPLAPFVMAAEGVVVLLVLFALWERRPYQ